MERAFAKFSSKAKFGLYLNIFSCGLLKDIYDKLLVCENSVHVVIIGPENK